MEENGWSVSESFIQEFMTLLEKHDLKVEKYYLQPDCVLTNGKSDDDADNIYVSWDWLVHRMTNEMMAKRMREWMMVKRMRGVVMDTETMEFYYPK